MGEVTSILFIVLHGNLQRELHQLPRQVHITQNKMSTSSPFSDSVGDEVLQTDSSVTRLHGPLVTVLTAACDKGPA
jgi:copper oxidase (laccase) domain-containing protein